MTDIPIVENKPKFYCETCKYSSEFSCAYAKHLKSQRHIRGGEKKIFKCEKCDYKTDTSHWNLKMHIMSKHATVEEKLKHKYYCSLCNSLSFSKLFFDNHRKTLSHMSNMAIANNGLPNANNIIEMPNNNPDITPNDEFKEKIKAEIKAELKAELRAELRHEIMSNIKKKLSELFI